MAEQVESGNGRLRLSPIICAVLSLAAAVLYYVFPTYVQSTKEEETILAGIALGCASIGLLLYLIMQIVFRRSLRDIRMLCAHFAALFLQGFIFVPNLVKFILRFRYGFVPVMNSNALGIWMLIFAFLLICGSVLHPRKVK